MTLRQLISFFIFFFVFVKLCHFLAVFLLSLRRCSPVCRASWRKKKKKTRSVIMFSDSCHSLFSCPPFFSFWTACLVMETSFISASQRRRCRYSYPLSIVPPTLAAINTLLMQRWALVSSFSSPSFNLMFTKGIFISKVEGFPLTDYPCQTPTN